MAASYLEASLDRLGAPVRRDDTIEICINPDGQVWGEFQGDHFMRGLSTPLTQTEIKDLGNQIASSANTTMRITCWTCYSSCEGSLQNLTQCLHN